MLVSLEQLLRGGVSKCRNPSLQKMFSMIGGGEKAGSGYDRIQSGWRSQHWRPPSLTTQDQPDRIRLVLPMVSLIPDEALAVLQRDFGVRLHNLREPEIQALVTAHLEKAVSNERLQEILADHPSDITQVLQGLCVKGMLVSNNRRRWTRYRLPTPEELLNSSRSQKELLTLGENNSSHSTEDSLHLLQLKDELKRLAQSVTKKQRARQTEMQDMIYKLCTERYLDVEYLAKILHRNKNGLRNRYLTPMVEKGLLQLRYPESPNSPSQAYIAIAKRLYRT